MKKVEKTAKKMVRGGKREKGFTLIELLIVIGILAIVAAVAIPNLTRFMGRGKGESYDSDQNSLQTLIGSYQAEFTIYPTRTGAGGAASGTYYLVYGQTTGSGYIGNGGAQASTAVNDAAGTALGDKIITVDDASTFIAGNWIFFDTDNDTVYDATEEHAIVLSKTATTMTLKDALAATHADNCVVRTREQGLVNAGLLASAPKSATANTGGAPADSKGSYTWYCDANGSAQSDPVKDSSVYP